ncbi:hypothetical protein A1O3_02926 [Capronia epimyces CBS 606.96]|uniref:Tyrosine specific protein phosphatases domain-containing protein n=1 Tax=Capronia epimyces CBS 606.96 TaxID=1182542 RepID=W9Z5V8_9EURO|nr:uncharacterized protein A1O3_02926 [Capronia epimyces CBS 606.96]EXJ89859.1 hypothetical protein A1O3_02926 [Capronia epimyces CBS 606.96]
MAASVAIGVLVGVGVLYFTGSYLFADQRPRDEQRVSESDAPLLKANSTFQSYKTEHGEYPAIRTFYSPHSHAHKLQAIANLPLLVFIHGLGGSLPQFGPLLNSLVNVAPCFGIELPGHGLSDFSPRDYGAYSFEASSSLWRTAIEQVCRAHGHQTVVFIAHSMGCSIAATLSIDKTLPFSVGGMTALCPKATPPSQAETASARRFLSLPDTVLDILRVLDRRGGLHSRSVERMAGQAAGIDLRRLQLSFNRSYKTPVWKRSALGCLPQYDSHGNARGGLPGQEVWEKIQVPLFLIAGESDTVTKPDEVTKIVSFLQTPAKQHGANATPEGKTLPVAASGSGSSSAREDEAEGSSSTVDPAASDSIYGTKPSTSEMSSHHSAIVKTAILPAPAAHALMYDHSTYRTVAGLIEDFLARYVSPQLSLGWQLQQLTTSGKWDVKNLEKWKKVMPVSGPIGPDGMFRALKTLREQDEDHTPAVFVRKWRDQIFAVIDISHDSPVYDTNALERGGIEYHKFPTVSKVPPTLVEVADFIALVDRLRGEKGHGKKAIGVHCHYGYNRTGFFIACYLIERMGYRPQDALDEFARAKPPGIRHDHFIDTLFMRYHVGLKKAPTMKNSS